MRSQYTWRGKVFFRVCTSKKQEKVTLNIRGQVGGGIGIVKVLFFSLTTVPILCRVGSPVAPFMLFESKYLSPPLMFTLVLA